MKKKALTPKSKHWLAVLLSAIVAISAAVPGTLTTAFAGENGTVDYSYNSGNEDGTDNGEDGTDNGEDGTDNGEDGTDNGEGGTDNGEGEANDGEGETDNVELDTAAFALYAGNGEDAEEKFKADVPIRTYILLPNYSPSNLPSDANGYYPPQSTDSLYLKGLSGAVLTEDGWNNLKGDDNKLNDGDCITGDDLSTYVEVDEVEWESYQEQYDVTGTLVPYSIKIQRIGADLGETGVQLGEATVDIHVDCYIVSDTTSIPIKTYVLNPKLKTPEDGSDQGVNSYYPSAETGTVNRNTGLPNAKLTEAGWEKLKASVNGSDPAKLEIGDQLVGKDLSEYVNIGQVDRKGYQDKFSVTDDIVPYVIKVQSEKEKNGAAKDDNGQYADIHVDCYVDMEVTMTYYPGFGENPESKHEVKVQTGSIYGVLDYKETDLPPRSGYTFLGWATKSGGEVAYEANENIPVISAMNFYAVWQKDEDSSGGGDDGDKDPPYVPSPRPDPDDNDDHYPPRPDLDDDDDDETVIPDESTPLAPGTDDGTGAVVVPEGPGGDDTVIDDDVPLASLPTEEIDGDETPVTNPPKTGVKTAGSVALLAGSLAVALATLKKRHSK